MRPDVWPAASVVDTSVTVGNTTTPVVGANTHRADLVLVNDGDEPIYLARGNDAVMNAGIRLNAAGGAYEINEVNHFTGVINAICASGQKNLTVSEGSVR